MFLPQYKQNVHLERVQCKLSDSQLAIRWQHCRYSENCTYEEKRGKSGLHSNDTGETPGGAIALEKQRKKILHMILMFDPSRQCVFFLSRFQSPSRCCEDGSPADVVSSERSNPASSYRVGQGKRGDGIIKKKERQVHRCYWWTKIQLPSVDVQSVNQSTKTVPLSNRHRTERLPESSAERCMWQSSKFHWGAKWINWSLYVLLQWME